MFVGIVSAQECWEPHTPGSYSTGAKVSRINHNYQANWGTDEVPGATSWGGWKDYGTCIGSTGPAAGSCWTTFKAGQYKAGSEISYLRKNYRANWSTSEIPGTTNWGGWQMIDECSDNTQPISNIALSDTTIIEGAGDNATVGFLSSNSDGVTYRLVAGSGDIDNSLFTIQGAILREIHSLKTSDKPTRLIRVEGMAGNGSKYTRSFTIVVKPDTKMDVATKIIETPSMLSQFALYSHDDMNIASGAKITGMIGSNSNISLADVISTGWMSKITGDIWVNGSVSTLSEAVITGNIYAPNGVTLGWNARLTGKKIDSVPTPYFDLPQKTIPVSNENVPLAWQESKVLLPGTYGDISVSDGGSITLKAGVYNCRSLSLNSNNIKIYLDILPGETVALNVEKNLRFGSNAQIVYLRNEAPSSLKIHTNQFTELEIPYASKIKANIVAPNTTVRINSDCVIYGSIYAKKIDVGNNVTVVRPPYLTDIWHSEWAYAPAFDMNQMSYNAILPWGTADTAHVQYTVLYPNLSVNVNKCTNTTGGMHYLFEINDPATTLTSYYTLDLTGAYNSVIYVNANANSSIHNGASWANAYTNLQDAIDDATVSGKEIWLAEGKYYPTKQMNMIDVRSKTFLLPQGVEIIGGFKGTETVRIPNGSPYRTILTGDVLKNDGEAIPSYPFDSTGLAKIRDNAYHVVTISGINMARSTRLKGVTIEHGVANGVGDDHYGGGVYSKYALPAIEECIVQNNLALSHGGGIYAGGGLQSFEKALFENNVSVSGSGGGVYLNESKNVLIAQTVFSKNRALGVNGKAMGGAIFVNGSEILFNNSVFYENSAKSSGGAVYGNNSKIKFVHATSTKNYSAEGVGGVQIAKGKCTIVNSILWNNKGEVAGDTISISYSCIEGGYYGEGNINTPPYFIAEDDGNGEDGRWGTNDDGLKFKYAISKCLDGATATATLDKDIVETKRPLEKGPDMGAYEMAVPPANASDVDLGYMTLENKFVNLGDNAILLQDQNENSLYKELFSRAALTIRILAPINSSMGETMYANIRIDNGGNSLGAINGMWFKRTEITGSHYIYTSRWIENGVLVGGKPLFLVQNMNTGQTDYYYVLKAVKEGSKIVAEVPCTQFP